MRILAIGLWLIAIGVDIYMQLWYAKMGYPKTWIWRGRLFLSGFLAGALGAWSIFMELPIIQLWFWIVVLGVSMGLFSVFLAPGKTQAWIPKQRPQDPSDIKR